MAHRRSLGFARDDKKERVVAKERAVAEPRHLSSLIWTGLAEHLFVLANPPQDCVLAYFQPSLRDSNS